jgi:hypothetical protein
LSKFLQIPVSFEKENPLKARLMKEEAHYKFEDHTPQYVSRTADERVKDNIIRVLTFPEYSHNGTLELIKEFDYTHNLVTNDGDIYYAKKGAGEAPSTNENFLQARMELRSASDTPAKPDVYSDVNTPITASRKTITGTYPKTNDTGDADNTGDAVDAVSYSYSWTTGDFNNGTIQGGCQHDNASPVGGTKLLNHFSITSFAKTASDTLKMFTNHAMEGI